jgi:hypothetical protein
MADTLKMWMLLYRPFCAISEGCSLARAERYWTMSKMTIEEAHRAFNGQVVDVSNDPRLIAASALNLGRGDAKSCLGRHSGHKSSVTCWSSIWSSFPIK